MMKLDEAVKRAIKEPTLDEAISWICVWETERVVRQAREFFRTGVPQGADGAGWDTCFLTCIKAVRAAWESKGTQKNFRVQVEHVRRNTMTLEVMAQSEEYAQIRVEAMELELRASGTWIEDENIIYVKSIEEVK